MCIRDSGEAADLLASAGSDLSRDDFASSEDVSIIRHIVVASAEATPASMMSAMAQALNYAEEEQAA